MREAVQFAAHYQNLVFFTHALEVLLHTVIEEEIESEDGTTSSDESLLSPTVEFLDHFDAALEVVVGCARKTEMARWPRLFNIVGNPKSLFEVSHPSKRPSVNDANRSFNSVLPLIKLADNSRIVPTSVA